MNQHNHITRDIKPEGECPSCDLYHTHEKHRAAAVLIPDVILLQEFRRRFINTVLEECEFSKVFESAGIDKLKRYLKEGYGLTTRKVR